jgi:hypothetical protein
MTMKELDILLTEETGPRCLPYPKKLERKGKLP